MKRPYAPAAPRASRASTRGARPARVGLALVGVVWRAVQILAADGAEAGAVLTADDLRRERERPRVARPRAHVEVPLVEIGRAELLPAAGLVDLARVDLDLVVRRLEAAHARAVELGAEAQPERVSADRVRSRRAQIPLCTAELSLPGVRSIPRRPLREVPSRRVQRADRPAAARASHQALGVRRKSLAPSLASECRSRVREASRSG